MKVHSLGCELLLTAVDFCAPAHRGGKGPAMGILKEERDLRWGGISPLVMP